MNKVKYTIAVTGLNNTDNPGPGVPVIRALREANSFNVRIIGLAYENLEPGIYMPGITDKVYQIPYPSKGIEAFINRIEQIHVKENINLIIPNYDAELYTFMRSAKIISSLGIKTYLPNLEQFEERHKANLPDFGNKYDVLVPKSISITNINDINKINEEFSFPVLVKGKFYDAYIANNKEQVLSYFNKIVSKWGGPVIIQEFITGVEVNVVALGDGNGNTMAAVPMRKQYITDKGKAWGGITLKDYKMLELTRDLISKTKWRGGMELEMIKTNENKYFIIEINPRIPAWVYLAVGAGQNIPESLVNLAMGNKVEAFTDYKVGIMFIRYSWDLIGNIADFEKLNMIGEL